MTSFEPASKGRKNASGSWNNGEPFIPDPLCRQCLAIFEKRYDRDDRDKNILKIDLRCRSECRLCNLLISRISSNGTSTTIDVRYDIEARSRCCHGFSFMSFRWSKDDYIWLNIVMSNQKENHQDDQRVFFEHDLPSCTNSEGSTAQAANWLEECTRTHQECKSAFPETAFVPSRLVEISGVTEAALDIRLREREDLAADIRYATLSHRWESEMPFKLTRDNLSLCTKAVPFPRLSKVFQDAIKFAWRLHIPYIWIDSLCIIQDSPQDWEAESSQMGSVYRSGVLNIATTGHSNAQEGLFVQRDAGLITPIAVPVSTDTGVFLDFYHQQHRLEKGGYYLADRGMWNQDVDRSPLSRRGWVAQERALSVRTIHVGAQQLYWDCVCKAASEVFPAGFPIGTINRSTKVMLKTMQNEHLSGTCSRKVGYEEEEMGEKVREDTQLVRANRRSFKDMPLEMSIWIRIVEIYSRCSLTFSKDKLVAISGIAQTMSIGLDCKYLAGLWREDMEHQLLWHARRPCQAPEKDGSRGPSWSWAAVDSEVMIDSWESKFQCSPITLLSQVERASVQLTTESQFGQVHSGTVVLTGTLGVLWLEDEEPTEVDSRDQSLLGTRQPAKGYFRWDTTDVESRFCLSDWRTFWRRPIFRSEQSSTTVSKSSDVFCLPIRIMNYSYIGVGENAYLQGLLLVPTGEQKGQFYRVGYFLLSTHQSDQGGSFGDLTASTELLDEEYFISKQGCGDTAKYTISIV